MSPGDRVLIRDGVYRERVVLATSGTEVLPIAFEPAPGAHVIMTGAEQLKEWQRVAGDLPIFEAPWPHRFKQLPWGQRSGSDAWLEKVNPGD